MKTIESSTTMTEFEAPVIRTKKWHKTIVTGKKAQTTDGKNLLINIKVGFDPDIAEFDCLDVEHVGKHKEREVTFCSDRDCTLEFTDETVFNVKYLNLTANVNEIRYVKDETHNVGTDCRVYTDTPTANIEEVVTPVAGYRGPPHIVVP